MSASTAASSAAPQRSFAEALLHRADLLFAGVLFATVLMLILPMPAVMLDTLLAMNIGSAMMVLLVVIYVKDPPEFSGFPTILLALTLFRLALNVLSTRLILTKGEAGNVIDSFGNFVIQGNYIVGFVVFLILIVINFMVITKGAGRIAEVSARFTLDALPGKQMAIDAELNAGIIDETTATRRRVKVQKEADFYGAMDGASKFVRGDAIAGILITLVNIIGGFAIGALQMDLSLAESAQKFTLLSIGDGLVSQIPALVISVAAGILVTRASSKSGNLGSQIGQQFVRYPRAMKIAGAMLGSFGLMPGMPIIPFALLGGMAFYVGTMLEKHPVADDEDDAPAKPAQAAGGGEGDAGQGGAGAANVGAKTERTPAEELKSCLTQDVFAIEIGYGLLPLVETAKGGELLGRITGVRKTIARERGLLVPPISVRDNIELEANEYRFLLRGRAVAKGSVMPGRWLAMNVSGSSVSLRGVPTKEPVFGIDAVWVDEPEKRNAELGNFTIVEPSAVMITHLSETLRNVGHLLLGRQDVQQLIDHVKTSHPALVSELLPDLVNLGIIQRVLQNLLRESISITNLPLILEGIGDYAPLTKNPDDLSERVRRSLGLYFVPAYETMPGTLKATTLDPRLEQILASKVHRGGGETVLLLDPTTAHHIVNHLAERVAAATQLGEPPVLVVGAEIRLALQRFLEPSFPRLAVIAFQEIPPATEIENSGLVPAPAGAHIPVPMPSPGNASAAAA
ncbi:flagellar biosynthesis protein FlhA [Actomonas aquatica]|uniref:Flagellar biosynthesis protein FlhA n=1 Tax=Actomonas aquatica TaxID=2866162 RepID=A0ABZ1CC49_9BACT|nr:flagellar biosynthesis protein FlhA [Opitutus sp. WL0086]WRQ89264.1 flagellar biosynthesis protein FlhA [Opitutus sp. WL0086]